MAEPAGLRELFASARRRGRRLRISRLLRRRNSRAAPQRRRDKNYDQLPSSAALTYEFAHSRPHPAGILSAFADPLNSYTQDFTCG